MTFKLAGLGFVMLCALLTGSLLSGRLIKRQQALCSILTGIMALKTRLCHSNGSIEKLLSASFIECEAIEVNKNRAFVKKGYLSREDEKLVNDFLSHLGEHGRERENERINMYEKLISDREQKSREEVSSRCKLINVLSICAGLMVCIIAM